MLTLDWLHGLLAAAAVLAPVFLNRFAGSAGQDALSKMPILAFLVKVLAARASLTAEEQVVVSQTLGETHPGIPAEILKMQKTPAPPDKAAA